RYQIPADTLDRLLAGGDVDYRDPMARVPGGGAYGGSWLAAIAAVSLPREFTAAQSPQHDAAATNLLVLVQYRLSKVFEPVGELKRQLLLEGTATLVAIFLLTFAMWFYVNQLTDPARLDDAADRVVAARDRPTEPIG